MRRRMSTCRAWANENDICPLLAFDLLKRPSAKSGTHEPLGALEVSPAQIFVAPPSYDPEMKYFALLAHGFQSSYPIRRERVMAQNGGEKLWCSLRRRDHESKQGGCIKERWQTSLMSIASNSSLDAAVLYALVHLSFLRMLWVLCSSQYLQLPACLRAFQTFPLAEKFETCCPTYAHDRHHTDR